VPIKSTTFQISGPAWFASEHYDVYVKVPPGATRAQVNVMIQNLIAERFQLNLHHVSKDFPAFDLIVGKNGLKFHESVETPLAGKEGFPRLTPGQPGLTTNFENGHARLTARRQPISALISTLKTYAGRPIRDKTMLTAKYDFHLHFDPRNPTAASEPDSAPAISVAIEQQLGLKFEAKKLPFDVLIIDRVEKTPYGELIARGGPARFANRTGPEPREQV